jgi:hypothetical protein
MYTRKGPLVPHPLRDDGLVAVWTVLRGQAINPVDHLSLSASVARSRPAPLLAEALILHILRLTAAPLALLSPSDRGLLYCATSSLLALTASRTLAVALNAPFSAAAPEHLSAMPEAVAAGISVSDPLLPDPPTVKQIATLLHDLLPIPQLRKINATVTDLLFIVTTHAVRQLLSATAGSPSPDPALQSLLHALANVAPYAMALCPQAAAACADLIAELAPSPYCFGAVSPPSASASTDESQAAAPTEVLSPFGSVTTPCVSHALALEFALRAASAVLEHQYASNAALAYSLVRVSPTLVRIGAAALAASDGDSEVPDHLRFAARLRVRRLCAISAALRPVLAAAVASGARVAYVLDIIKRTPLVGLIPPPGAVEPSVRFMCPAAASWELVFAWSRVFNAHAIGGTPGCGAVPLFLPENIALFHVSSAAPEEDSDDSTCPMPLRDTTEPAPVTESEPEHTDSAGPAPPSAPDSAQQLAPPPEDDFDCSSSDDDVPPAPQHLITAPRSLPDADTGDDGEED